MNSTLMKVRRRNAKHGLRPLPSVLHLLTVAALAWFIIGGTDSALAAENELAARFDEADISLQQVDANVQRELNELQAKIFRLRRRGLEELIAERIFKAEAAKRNTTVQAVYDAEVAAKVAPVSRDDLRAFYDSNRKRITAPFNQIRQKIFQYLTQQRRTTQRQKFVERMKTEHHIEILLQPPRVRVSTDDDPGTGAVNPAITIIEFSDFECPFCRRSYTVLKEVLRAYPTSVRLVYRDFPLETIHRRARAAALAANCANEQGQFWPYHDLLFENQKNMSDENLRAYAAQLALNANQFRDCLATKKHNGEIDQDIEAGRKLGVNSTPTFYVNGRLMTGAASFATFQALIEDELQILKYSKR